MRIAVKIFMLSRGNIESQINEKNNKADNSVIRLKFYCEYRQYA